MRALLFSGQGSQYVGMGKDLLEAFSQASDLISKANDILGYSIGDIMANGPEDVLRRTIHTQPALFVHEAAILAITHDQGRAVAVAGHSLGEFSAYYAAGVLTFEDALRLVQTRATLMFNAGERVAGTMAAIVGLDDEVVRGICAELTSDAESIIVPANFNSPGQIVISGSAEFLRQSLPVFKERGAKIVKELAVSGAFHSPLMSEAQAGLAEQIRTTTFSNASIPVYVNVTARPLLDAEEIQQAALAQLTAPVLWSESLTNMWENGIVKFREIGPGKVLQGLVKRTLPSAECDGVDTSADVLRALSEIS